MNEVILAAVQMACGPDQTDNLARAEAWVRQAARAGAALVVLPELFDRPYFCKDQRPDRFAFAAPLAGHPVIERMRSLAGELRVVLPVSVFEQAGPVCFNSLVVIDGNGKALGVYRKAHIPDGHGYQEKYYFSPGDTGFRAFATQVGPIGCAVCWDQWFPEAARAMVLKGAEILVYPTAIGSEPQEPELDSRDHWIRVMQGHAAANLVPVVAANRIGREQGESCAITFYGSSFIAGPTGEVLAQAGRDEETVVLAAVDLAAIRARRTAWGVFRDRRPDLYGVLLTLDGVER
jgi:N-carbamoylputrescine amidase